MTETEHLAHCWAWPERSTDTISPSRQGTDPEQCGPILRADPAEMQHCPCPYLLSLLSLPENFAGRGTNPGKMVGEAEVPRSLPLSPLVRQSHTEVGLFYMPLSSWPGQPMLWLPGAQNPIHPENREWGGHASCCLQLPDKREKLTLSGWFHFLVPMDLSDGFGVG